jgi:alpha-L-arabinofuranosidase
MSFVYDPLDFDEYISVCRNADAEPVVVVAADNYLRPLKPGQWVSSREDLLEHAAEWVRYANIKKKYNVRYWMIANESWNKNNVNSNAEIYAQDVIDFSKAMKAVDPTVLIIANGANDDFFKTVITRAGDYIDRLTVSNYGVYNFHNGYNTYRDTSQVLIWPAITAIKAMHAHATPSQLKKLKVIVAEYGTIDWAGLWDGTNDMGHAIVTFDMTGQLLKQRDIEFSCFWNTRWIENGSKPARDHDAIDENGNLYPTGQALKIWGNFLGNQMIKSETTGNIVTFASFDPHSQMLFAYFINKTDQPADIRIELSNKKIESVLDAWELFGSSPYDINPKWQQMTHVKSAQRVSLKGTSITVIKMKIKGS